jgi:hypothetical protein
MTLPGRTAAICTAGASCKLRCRCCHTTGAGANPIGVAGADDNHGNDGGEDQG